MHNVGHTIYSFLILLLAISALTACGNGNDKMEEPINLSRTISSNGITYFSGNPSRNAVFQDEITPPDQETILLTQQNNPDADNVAFADTTATVWKFYLER